MNCSTPLPHINVENDIFYVGKVYAVRKINIAIGARGEFIMDERVIDFQNIFAHDCSFMESKPKKFALKNIGEKMDGLSTTSLLIFQRYQITHKTNYQITKYKHLIQSVRSILDIHNLVAYAVHTQVQTFAQTPVSFWNFPPREGRANFLTLVVQLHSFSHYRCWHGHVIYMTKFAHIYL